MIEEDGKFYQVIRAVPGRKEETTEDELCKLDDRYGPILLKKRTTVFLSFLEREAALYEEILKNLRAQGLQEEKRRARYEQVEALLQDNMRVRQM